MLIDFSTEDDFQTPLVNGQDIAPGDEFGGVIASIEGSGYNRGAAIFDTTLGGPNDPGPDPDLLNVGYGNALILQQRHFPAQSIPGIFDHPNDAAQGGTIDILFGHLVHLISIDLFDICANDNEGAVVRLFDQFGGIRTYTVPAGYTSVGDGGVRTLDLETLLDQPGATGDVARAEQDDDFEPDRVVALRIVLAGSGAVDDLHFCRFDADDDP